MSGNLEDDDDEKNISLENESFEDPDKLVEKSLGFIPLDSQVRKKIIKFVASGSPFDSFILCMIMLNSISMACTDYRFVDEDYNPRTDISTTNKIVEILEFYFTGVFVVEAILKIIAFGFVWGNNTYLRDHWNKLDFFVVIVSIIGMIPLIPNLTAIRTIRVLRPLRSISKLPGLKKIIGALVDSLKDLANVILLLFLILLCFSIMGVLFWRGLLHARCRLTPFPVKLSTDCRNVTDPCWQIFISDVVKDPDSYRCLPDENDDKSWTQSSSPWLVKGPQDCIWPIDLDDERVCSLGGKGSHTCPAYLTDGHLVERTCGSNYDAFGNPRFVASTEPYGFNRMDSGNFIEALNWGYTNYDTFIAAFVTTFQAVTLEGWTDIMYQTIDAWSVGPSIAIFVVLTILGGHIVLNLVLAVITMALDKLEDEGEVEKDSNDVSSETVDNNAEGIKKTKFLKNPWFANFMMTCITLNTVVLGLDHYMISDEMSDILEKINCVLTFIFFFEMCISIYELGLREYWSDPFYCFDGFTVAISILEIVLVLASSNASERPTAFSVFRALRLFRVFKMARRWKSLHSLLETMYETVLEIGNFGILLLLFIFIYALVGIQLFANRMHFHPITGAAVVLADPGYSNAVIPRSNFDNLWNAMTTVFQILTGENWNSIMYDGWRATSWLAVIYFLSLMVIGVFIVMNLFLAILLKNFEDNNDLVHETILKDRHNSNAVSSANEQGTSETQKTGEELNGHPEKSERSLMSICKANKPKFLKIVRHPKFDLFITSCIIANSVCLAMDNPLTDPKLWYMILLQIVDIFFTIIFFAEMMLKILAFGFLLGPKTYLRNWWNVLDFVVVMISILDLGKIGPGSTLRAFRVLRVLRPLRMISRLPELKLVVDALLMSLPAVGNVFIICTLFFFMFAVFGVNYLKGSFYWCSGEVFESLTSEQKAYLTDSIPWGQLSDEEQSWFDVDSVTCTASSWDSSTIPTSQEVCDCLAPGEWVDVIPQNFNNVLNAMALLFEISTTEGWVDVMHAAIDHREIGHQPVRDNNPAWAIFFILFLVVGAFFVLELFVGVIIENFDKLRCETGRGLMTSAQKEWASTQAFIVNIKPEKRLKKPKGRIRAWCYDFVMPSINPKFDQTILVFICLNCICMALTEFGDSQQKTDVLHVASIIFAIIFTTEAAIKITALSTKYFDDGWNVFDFVIVCGTIIGFLMEKYFTNLSSLTSIIRFLRVGRLVRVIKFVKRLRILFNTMVTSIPSIANIGSLLFLFFFIYAVCGVQLYSYIASNDDLNESANFRSFGNALLLLLRFSTGENWNGFMRSMLKDKEGCDPEPVFDLNSPWCLEDNDYPYCTELNGCGEKFSPFIYFYSFTLIVSFVVLNLFVGVVLEAFDNSREGDILSPEDLLHFTNAWAEFDPEATWYISTDDLKKFVRALEPPLGLGKSTLFNESDLENNTKGDKCLLDIPVNGDGMVNIVHVATHLAKRLAIEKQGDDFNELSDDHPIQQRIKLHNEGMNKTLRDVYNPPKQKLRAIHLFTSTTRRNLSTPKSPLLGVSKIAPLDEGEEEGEEEIINSPERNLCSLKSSMLRVPKIAPLDEKEEQGEEEMTNAPKKNLLSPKTSVQGGHKITPVDEEEGISTMEKSLTSPKTSVHGIHKIVPVDNEKGVTSTTIRSMLGPKIPVQEVHKNTPLEEKEEIR